MGRTKLTPRDVALIRLLYASFPGLKQQDLGRFFGVTGGNIGWVIRRKTHRNVR